MNPSSLKVLLFGIALTALTFNHTPAWAGPPIGLIDFDAGDGGFTVVSTNTPGGPWSYDFNQGSWSAFDQDDCGAVPFRSSRLNSPIWAVPTAGSVTFSFTHRYSFEADTTRWDGGQLRISVNHAPYVEVPLARFSANGYNNTVGGADVPNCELVGQQAFTAQSTGYELSEYITSVATLGPFHRHDVISIQFLAAWDDCVQGMVPNWEIISLRFTPAVEEISFPPAFADATLPADAAVPERQAHTLQAAAVGYLSFQWYKEMDPIPGATSSNYTITKMSMADAGHYFVDAINLIGSSRSRVATITMIPDTTPPAFVSAEWCAEGEPIVIRLSEPLRPDNGQGSFVTDEFIWSIERVTGPGGDPGSPVLGGVVYNAGEEYIYLTPQPGSMDPSATYRVVLLTDLLDEAASGNILPANSSVSVMCPGAISVGPAGAGPFTFDSPPRVQQFSTVLWAGGANGIVDAFTMNENVQLLDASSINTALSPVAGAPPAAAIVAQWASGGKYLITRPTGVNGGVIMATLRNDSGQTLTALGISYDLKVETAVAEELPGHFVYYSVSGFPDTWLPVPGLSGNGASGLKKGLLDLSDFVWSAGSTLYVLWADDNGSGSPDRANEIDNFSVSLVRPALSISYASPNVTITWPAGSGVLQSKVNLGDLTWTDVPGAGSSGSASVAAGGPHKFFTLRAP